MKDRAEIYPTRESWEAARGGQRIGASVVGDILAAPWDALATLTGASAFTASDLKRFARGHRFEAAVLEQYADQTGEPMLPAGEALGSPGALVIVRHPTEAWATCSPDGLTTDLAIVGEAKTWGTATGIATEDTTIPNMDAYDPNLCPQYIAAQVYWQLEVTGVDVVSVAFLLPRYALRIVRFERDATAQADLLSQVGDWRERHLIRGEPLPVDASDACRLVLGRRLPAGGSIEPDEMTEAIVRERMHYQRERDAARVIADAAETEMKLRDNALLERVAHLLPVPGKKPTNTVSIPLLGGGKWYAYPVAGHETVSMDALRAQPQLLDALRAAGIVTVTNSFIVAKASLPKD